MNFNDLCECRHTFRLHIAQNSRLEIPCRAKSCACDLFTEMEPR